MSDEELLDKVNDLRLREHQLLYQIADLVRKAVIPSLVSCGDHASIECQIQGLIVDLDLNTRSAQQLLMENARQVCLVLRDRRRL